MIRIEDNKVYWNEKPVLKIKKNCEKWEVRDVDDEDYVYMLNNNDKILITDYKDEKDYTLVLTDEPFLREPLLTDVISVWRYYGGMPPSKILGPYMYMWKDNVVMEYMPE